MRILTNALNKILAGCCCIILAVMVACVSAGGGALYIQRAKQHARRIHPDSFMWMILLGGVYTAGLKNI